MRLGLRCEPRRAQGDHDLRSVRALEYGGLVPQSREYLEHVLSAVRQHGSINQAAAALGMPRSTLQEHVKAARFEIGESQQGRRELVVSAVKAEIAALKADALSCALPPAATVQRAESGYMLEINIPDLHVGKLAWSKETGHEDYDSQLAVQVFDQALATLLARTSSYTFDEIVFVLGNDLLHADTKTGTTTKGTPLDTDSRYHRSFLHVRRMATRAIQSALQHAPLVRVVMVPGNHDTLSVWHLGDSLECLFSAEPRVVVDNAPTMRKYLRFGSTMLLLTHGNTGKIADYPLLMATEQPAMWASCAHREAHTGDKHQTKTQEFHGVRVRILPALCPPDAWHADNHFVGNQRSAEAFVWHKDQGLVGTAIYTVERGAAA